MAAHEEMIMAQKNRRIMLLIIFIPLFLFKIEAAVVDEEIVV